jgi:C1A family cysteine protease
MMNVDTKGYMHVSGQVVGGHAYLIKGVNMDSYCSDGTRGAFRVLNSWSQGWGVNGCASISFADMTKLMNEYGEACTAIEQIKI